MNYELAKRLKDAKFPFVWSWITEDEELEKVPVLSDLIEALGDRFYRLSKTTNDHRWLCEETRRQNNTPNRYAVGDTAEEAVASLWLDLNKKL